MKNQFTSRIVKLTFAFMFILIASSCSQDDEAMDAAALAKEINSEVAAKASSKASTQSTFKITQVSVADCASGCINERVLFEDNTNDQVGNSSNYKNVNYQIWNTATQLIVQTTNNFATDKVEIVVNGVTYTNDPALDIPANQVFYTYFNLPEGYNACEYTLTSVIVFGGPQAELTGINYGVYEYCPIGCDEEFTYVDNGDKTYTFTYTPEADAIGALVEFTFAQGVAVSGLSAPFTQNGGVSSVWSAIMDLNECETYTWTVTLDADCSGNSPQSNVWTDFKVNSVSKKLDPEDKFTQLCP
ncbi:MAG: hypothetical protein A3F91_02870 [Flavobacteria bacterium RIFCSPLOWO2_12_FULL_35_11]|nr:MAG: hypothetical protein A3F91_02870 [Flavobacteria bacterium RIFCSPLOWO2_12_FULL_35_11]